MGYWCDQIKKNKTCLTYGVYGGEERCNLKGRKQLEDLDINGVIIQRWIIKKQFGKNVGRLYMAEDRDN